MNTRKQFYLCSLFAMALLFMAKPEIYAQQKTEKIHKLNKKAQKGYLFEAGLNDSGNLEIVYNIKSGKDKVVYEVYEFDKSTNFIGSKELETRKSLLPVKPAKTVKYVYATVGGGSSFTILSTKLNLYTSTVNKNWDAEKQRYRSKTIKKEELKPRNAENKTFNGNVSYQLTDGSLMLLVSSTKTEKDDKNKEYSLLKVGIDLEMQEIPIKFDRPHVLTYSLLVPKGEYLDEEDEEIASNHDMLFIFAPTSGNMNDYTLIQFDTNGKEKFRFTVNSPNNIMAVTAHNASTDGSVYLCALSLDSKRYFDGEIGEYAPIENPSYLKFGTANYRMEVYEKKMEKVKFQNFLTMKIKDGKLLWINSTPISDFKTKLKTPPAQKNGYSYDGKRFVVNGFFTTPDEGFIITGQRKEPVFKQAPNHIQYRDLICLRIDSKGNVVSQFSYKPGSLSDKKSIIFPIPQSLIPSRDGKSLYWTNYEVKAVKGYASFYDAYNSVTTFYANYYPAVGKINLENNNISNFDIMGNKKFLLNRHNAFVDIPSENARIFIGEDKKGKIMLAKYVFD